MNAYLLVKWLHVAGAAILPGWPAFIAVGAIFWLMIARPA